MLGFLSLLPLAAATPALELVAQVGHARPEEVTAHALDAHLVLSLSADAAILWERETGRELLRTARLSEGGAWTAWTLLREERRLIGVSSRGGVALFDPMTLERLSVGPAPPSDGRPWEPCLQARVSEDGQWALCDQRSGLLAFNLDDPSQQRRVASAEDAEGVRWRVPIEPEGLPLDARGDPVLQLPEGPFPLRSLVRPVQEARLQGSELRLTAEGQLYHLGWEGALEVQALPAATPPLPGESARWSGGGETWVWVEGAEEQLLRRSDGLPAIAPWPRSAWRPQRDVLLRADPGQGQLWVSDAARGGVCVIEVARPWRRRCRARGRALLLGADRAVDAGRLVTFTTPRRGEDSDARLSAWDPEAGAWRLLGAPEDSWLQEHRYRRLSLLPGLVAVHGDTELRLYPLSGGPARLTLPSPARAVHAHPSALVTTHADGLVRLWSPETGALLATVALLDAGWVVLDAEGRFDRSEPEPAGLHWALRDEVLVESLSLDQLERYFLEPRLLRKLLDPELDLRALEGLEDGELPPSVRWTRAGDTLEVTLRDRGGGVGRVALFINGVEVRADVRPEGAGERFAVDLSPYRRFLLGDGRDQLHLQAWSAEERVASRGGASRDLDALLGGVAVDDLDIWLLIVGAQDYEDDALDLSFSEDDARVLASALRAGGEAMLGELGGEVRLQLLSTAEGETAPSEERLQAAFAEIAARADPWDVLIVSLSGHGVFQDGRYYFALPSATGADLSDVEALDTRALSQEELMDLLRSVPANKTLLILDTCASGGFIEGARDEPAADAQRRALEELKDRMGLVILAGAPASASAYEHEDLGHGLLTYALLEGLRAGAPGEPWEVSALAAYVVEEVPRIARILELGDAQEPLLSAPGGNHNFQIGARPDDLDRHIPLKPLILPTVVGGPLVDREQDLDHLHLTEAFDRAMDAVEEAPAAPLRWSPKGEPQVPWQVGGTYVVVEGEVRLRLGLRGPDGALQRVELTAPDAAAAARCGARWVERAVVGVPLPPTLDAAACEAL